MSVWYRGGGFCGFQTQPGERTVQDTLRAALAALELEVMPLPASRTDKGVHARMQVVSFRLPIERAPAEVARAMNARLPDDVGIAAAAWAPPSFHAQWSSSGKEYRYRLAPGPRCPEAWRGAAWHLAEDPAFRDEDGGSASCLARLDFEALRRQLARIPGRRTFSPFHANSSVVKEREIWSTELVRLDAGPETLWEIRFRGSAFGRYMIRYLVGGAVAAASGLLPEQQFLQALEEEVPFKGLRAAACGLVLWEALYPAQLSPFGGAGAEGQDLCPPPRDPPFHG